eukprot:1160905-Pelagomonas_calceolata.AAC.11
MALETTFAANSSQTEAGAHGKRCDEHCSPIQCQRGCTFFLHVILVYVLAMQVVACCLEELCEQKSKTVV